MSLQEEAMMKPAEEAMTAWIDDTNLGAENGKLTTQMMHFSSANVAKGFRLSS